MRRFYNLGFNIEATAGTANFLKKTRHPHPAFGAKSARALAEIFDSIRAGYVSYVINTRPLDPGAPHRGRRGHPPVRGGK